MTRKLMGATGLGMLLALALSAGCTITVEPGVGTASGDFTGELPFEGVTALTVDWRNGAIEVRFSDTATAIEISGTQRVTAESEEAAQAALDDWEIALAPVSGDAASVLLAFNAPSSSSRVYRANVEVVVPAAVTLTIDNENGSIDITGNGAATDVQVANGSVAIIGQTGNTTVVVTNGSVEIEANDGNIDVQASNGSIAIDSTGGNVEVQTENGSIEIDARPEENGTISAIVRLGSIDIRVPADFAASIALEADLGQILRDLSDFTVTELEEQFGEVTATLNGGGGMITAESSIGNVTFESLP